MTKQVSHRPIKCQSHLWSQRGTKVNGSHRGDHPLRRPTGIQIATKSYATLQAMAPTNIKTVHQTPLLHIDREQPRSTRIVVAYCNDMEYSSYLCVFVIGASYLPQCVSLIFSRIYFSCSTDHEWWDWPPCKVVFSGWQPIR